MEIARVEFEPDSPLDSSMSIIGSRHALSKVPFSQIHSKSWTLFRIHPCANSKSTGYSGTRAKATKNDPVASIAIVKRQGAEEKRTGDSSKGPKSKEPDGQTPPDHQASYNPSPFLPTISLSSIFEEKTKGRPIPEIRPPPRPTLTAKAWKDGTAPPEFIINLDQPPEKRWAHVVDWGIQPLRGIISKLHSPNYDYFWDNELMRSVERRFSFSNEQYAEMQGISNHSGIPFHKILDYNLVLNSQFGCTSGTAPLIHSNKLMHFRVLDPTNAMPHLLIQAHFVRRDELVASAIMHLGHVAIITGVRQGLSLSINTKYDYSSYRGTEKFFQAVEWALYDPWCITIRDLLLREITPSLKAAKKELAHGEPKASFAVVSDGKDASAFDLRWKQGSAWRDAINGVLVQGNHYADRENRIMIDAMLPAQTHGQLLEKSHARVTRLQDEINRSLQQNNGTKLPALIDSITRQPVKHDATSLACIMDPTEGNIIWSAAYRGRT